MDERKQEQASSYALGALPEEERAAFEASLARDPELRRLVGDFTDALGAVAAGLPKPAPPAGLKQRILAAAAERPPGRPGAPAARPDAGAAAPSRPALIPFPVWIPWAAAAVLGLAALWLGAERATLQDERQRLAADIERMRSDNETLDASLASVARANDTLRDELAVARRAANVAELRVARLESQVGGQPGALAVSLWNDVTKQGVLVVENLALPPPGKTYQLWVLDPTTQAPIDAGIFTTDAEGRGRMIFRPKADVANAAQFAVSLEAAGGAPSPQGPIVMIGPTTRL